MIMYGWQSYKSEYIMIKWYGSFPTLSLYGQFNRFTPIKVVYTSSYYYNINWRQHDVSSIIVCFRSWGNSGEIFRIIIFHRTFFYLHIIFSVPLVRKGIIENSYFLGEHIFLYLHLFSINYNCIYCNLLRSIQIH